VGDIGIHAHHDLGLHVAGPEVDPTLQITLLQRNRDGAVGIAVLVADDRVGVPELRTELFVFSEILEQLSDRVVDLLGILEIGHCALSSRLWKSGVRLS
jgi:hypothetical protein